MNPRFSRSALSIFIASAGLMLAACGGGSSSGSSTDNADDSGDHTHEEHEHSGRVLFSESASTTLQVFALCSFFSFSDECCCSPLRSGDYFQVGVRSFKLATL